jgi:hypothetical protein|tara:strand:+ start:1459 stop:1815 length:357 start_codon:yes stop_codon:yes gene_type:complete
MGRYYDGDIYGKFWFALQSSNAADRFGVEGEPPGYLEYYFDREELPYVEEEIKKIEDSIDEKLIESYLYGDKGKYTDETLEQNGISKDQLRDYADLRLGRQIRDCIKEHGECNFTAEL